MTLPSEMQSTIPPTPKKHGCLFYGCMTVILVVVIGGGILGFASWYLFKYLKDSYTASTPIQIEQVVVSEEEINNVQKSFEDLKLKIEEGTESFTHTITSRDIQTLMQHSTDQNNTDGAKLSDFANVEIKNNEIHAKWSAPIPLPFFGIRFFNGEGYGTLSYSSEKGFVCNLREVTINGFSLSPDTANTFCENIPFIESGIPSEENKDIDPFTERLESLQIKDGAIELKFGEKKETKEPKVGV